MSEHVSMLSVMHVYAEAPIIPAAFPAIRANPAALDTCAPSESKTSSISALWFAGFAPVTDCILLDIARLQLPSENPNWDLYLSYLEGLPGKYVDTRLSCLMYKNFQILRCIWPLLQILRCIWPLPSISGFYRTSPFSRTAESKTR